MNRLNTLEANTALYAFYVEEQTSTMWEMFRRLSEDIGCLKGIGRTQAQLYKTVEKWSLTNMCLSHKPTFSPRRSVCLFFPFSPRWPTELSVCRRSSWRNVLALHSSYSLCSSSSALHTAHPASSTPRLGMQTPRCVNGADIAYD